MFLVVHQDKAQCILSRPKSRAIPSITAFGTGLGMSAPAPVPTASQLTPQSVDAATLCKNVGEALAGKDLNLISLRELREKVAISLGFQSDALDPRKSELHP